MNKRMNKYLKFIFWQNSAQEKDEEEEDNLLWFLLALLLLLLLPLCFYLLSKDDIKQVRKLSISLIKYCFEGLILLKEKQYSIL